MVTGGSAHEVLESVQSFPPRTASDVPVHPLEHGHHREVEVADDVMGMKASNVESRLSTLPRLGPEESVDVAKIIPRTVSRSGKNIPQDWVQPCVM